MTGAVSPGMGASSRFKSNSSKTNAMSSQPAIRTFKVNPYDYKPLRVGVRYLYKAIVIDYELKSRGKRYLHNIKVGKYSDPMAFGISVSRSGSFADAL